MGFRPKKRTQTVTMSEGSDWYGLEIETMPMSFDTWLALTASGASGLTMRDVITAVERLSENVVNWNLEDADTGEPVGTDPETVMHQDPEMLTEAATRWVQMVVGVDDPLPPTSDDTPSLPGVSLPTETLSLPPESSGELA